MIEDISRPDPDELLAQVKAEAEQEKRGKLKIFLGYAPGTGKTYTMLEAGRQRRKDTDVVIAIVETHSRVDTEALLSGFDILSRKQSEYHGVTLSEMDIDTVLARHPQLALVDEFAHENIPGSRHARRYQDVEELLQAGIDVYTTLNVQHIESGRNVVAQITGVWVRETVPDSIIDIATEIELVDLPPDELINRLKEGKVYVPEQIAPATEKFFRKGNLTALRELALRIAAKHVDQQTLAYMKTHAVGGSWPSGERLLLYIGPDSWGSRLVRGTRRLAYELGAVWTATDIETPENVRLSPLQQDRINETLKLAQRLGAKTITIQGESIAAAVIDYAKANNITKIVAAKPRKSLRRLFIGSAVDRIIRNSEDIDVHLLGTTGEAEVAEEIHKQASLLKNWQHYLKGFGLVVLATLLGQVLHGIFTPTTIAMLYLLCVVVASFLWGLGTAIMVSFLGVLAFDFFNIPPYLTFAIGDTQYIFTFLVLMGIGIIISYLSERVRHQSQIAKQHENQTAALYTLGRDLAMSNDLESYINAISKRAKETFGREAIILLPDSQNKEILRHYTANSKIGVSETELAAATWTFQHQKTAGPGTDTLPNTRARHVPLVTARGTVGVIALLMDTGEKLSIVQERFLEGFADLAAVALESILLAEEAQNTRVLRKTEKLQTALLNSVSHDLRTPLVSIIGVLSSLQEEGMNLDNAARKNLIGVAREEAERLNHLITNLLDVSRIEAGAIKINLQAADVQDLVGAALQQMEGFARNRQINVGIPAELPCVSVDFGLTVQTLVNVLDNAIKYSAADSSIDISGSQAGNDIYIEVADHGVGIPSQDLIRVFDKFYRIQRPDNATGTGLGLSICKGMVEAQGGQITAENRPGGGTVIRLILPISGISGISEKTNVQ
jgi:two-component system, OmpR family, sensor histidine kinase KdpD